MFVHLPNNTQIYAVSAANPTESSWGYYCSPDDVVSGKHIGSCLGDLFSINFLEDSDKGNYGQTLNQQFDTIKTLTNKSHVMQWGDLSFADDKIGDFLTGSKHVSSNFRFIRPVERVGAKTMDESVMDSRTNKLQSLAAIYAREHSPEIFEEMTAEIESMQTFEAIFRRLSSALGVDGKYNPRDIKFDCLRATVDGFEEKCGKFTDYGLGFIKYLSHSCETMEPEQIMEAIEC
jgi:legumain